MVRSPSTSWLSATSAFAGNAVFARRAATAATQSGRPSYAGDRRAVRRMPHAAPIKRVLYIWHAQCADAPPRTRWAARARRVVGVRRGGRHGRGRRGPSIAGADPRGAPTARLLQPACGPRGSHSAAGWIKMSGGGEGGRRRSRGYRRRGPVGVGSRPPGERRCGVLGMLHVARRVRCMSHVARRVCAVCSSSVCSSSRGGHAAATGRGLV